MDASEIDKGIVDTYINELAKMSQPKYQIELIDFSHDKQERKIGGTIRITAAPVDVKSMPCADALFDAVYQAIKNNQQEK